MSRLKIYLARLKDGHTLKIDQVVDPEIMDIEEQELRFDTPLSIRGEAYLVDDHLVLRGHLSIEAKMPCSVCNAEYAFPVVVEDWYHVESVLGASSSIFYYEECVRSAILLQIPSFIECKGLCPHREEMQKYLLK